MSDSPTRFTGVDGAALIGRLHTQLAIAPTDTHATLYYEAHITIEPVIGMHLDDARRIAADGRFKVADTLERSANDTFMTGHGTSLNEIKERTRDVVRTLIAEGFQVWRYKIEYTILDSRTNDVFGLLPSVKEAI
jgi:hypothetical protein